MILQDPQRLANLLLTLSRVSYKMTPIQVGNEIKELLVDNNKQDVVRMLSTTSGTINTYLKLLKQPKEIQDQITWDLFGAFRYISKLNNIDIQEMIDLYNKENLTIKELDNIVQTRVKTGRDIADIAKEVFNITRPNVITKYVFMSKIETIDPDIAKQRILDTIPGIESIKIDGDTVRIVSNKDGNDFINNYPKKNNVEYNDIINDIVL